MELSDSPGWASGHDGDGRWAPKHASDFATFAAAAAKRWPSIHLWLIWPEPTQKANFQPLISEHRDKPLTAKMRRGPHRYAQILDASYGALKRVSPKNLVIGGNTFTTGDVSVLNWIKNLRLPNGKPPRMDMYGEYIAWTGFVNEPAQRRVVQWKHVRDPLSLPPTIISDGELGTDFCDWCEDGNLLVSVELDANTSQLAIFDRQGRLIRRLDTATPPRPVTGASWRKYGHR